MLPILLSLLASSSIHWWLTHCFTITSLHNPLDLSRHWAWSLRILVQKNSLLLLVYYEQIWIKFNSSEKEIDIKRPVIFGKCLVSSRSSVDHPMRLWCDSYRDGRVWQQPVSEWGNLWGQVPELHVYLCAWLHWTQLSNRCVLSPQFLMGLIFDAC